MNVDFLYGTAWKGEQTASLTFQALVCGFRAVDTANQLKHYNEAGAAQGVIDFMGAHNLKRTEIFLQSKFTHPLHQDHRRPYDVGAPTSKQLLSSFDDTLSKFQTDYLDSYLLHAPVSQEGLSDVDREAWQTMERLYKQGRVRSIGVSNFSLAQLAELCGQASIKPKSIQNRCRSTSFWDRDIRQYCECNGIQYQGFSLLTANTHLFESIPLFEVATSHGLTKEQLIFSFAHQIGILPLTGTQNPQHMKLDLEALETQLSTEAMEFLENIG